MGLLKKQGNINLVLLSGLVLLGFLLRLYAFTNSTLINPDGINYINQAKAISAGNWELARNCGYDFISLYHLLIPVFYKISGDWIISAKSVSLVFGTAAIIPFYLMMRQLFRGAVAGAASLGFAMHPFFVARSIELIKDPIFWFFALLGMSFITTAITSKNKTQFLLFSSVSFLLAGMARLEILIYFAGTIIYILLFEDAKKRKMFLFCLPVVSSICLLIISDLFLFKNHGWGTSYLSARIQHFYLIFSNNSFGTDISKNAFFALTVLTSKTAEALSPLFIPLFLTGFWSVKKKLRGEPLFWYFIINTLLALITLYFFSLLTGILSQRYTVFAILPGSIFVCFGIENILQYLKTKNFQERSSLIFICACMITVALMSKNLYQRTDKTMYKNIGEYIASAEKDHKTVIMSADSRTMFYANFNSGEIECADPSPRYKDLFAMQYGEMVSFLRLNRINYLLWEEKIWKNAAYDLPGTAAPGDLKKIMQQDSGQGKVILFKVLD
ncbi:MAG: glycosyltransferase family 39 protein [Thermodesulfovibrionales bacterium]